MADAHANFAFSSVVTAPSPATSGTSLVVTSGQGALFPAVSFNAVICPNGQAPTTTNAEIVRVTTIATDTFTITRAQESSTARSVIVGDTIYAAPTKKTFTDIETTVNGTTVPLTGTAWTAPTLLNSWVNTGGAGIAVAGYMKDPLGIVHLKGRIKTGATNTVAFVLPAGFRPGGADFYPAIISGAATVAFAIIDTAGNVSVGSGSGVTTDISLGGITFLAEN